MTGRVVSLNVGRPIQVPHRGGMVSTGIFKTPADGPVMLRAAGFDGDGQADLTVHGGEHKAAYVYSADDYDWWAGELGHPLQPGEFGENVTVTGYRDADVSVGDLLALGTAVVQVTSPREPCFKLGIRMGDHRFPARFREAARLGFYVRVVQEGQVGAGDGIHLREQADGSVTIAEFHNTYVTGRNDRAAIERLRAAPNLEPGWIAWCQKRLAEMAG